MIHLPPLLLTSSVKVFAPFTKISDQSLRIELTIKSIENSNEIVIIGKSFNKYSEDVYEV